MKINIIIVLLFLSCIIYAGESTPTVALLDFEANNIEESIAGIVTDNLIGALTEHHMFTMVERKKLDALFAELTLTDSDDFTDEQIIEIGMLAKATFILTGTVALVGKQIHIHARFIDVETGRILFGKSVRAKKESKLIDAVNELAYLLVYGYRDYEVPVDEKSFDDSPLKEDRNNVTSDEITTSPSDYASKVDVLCTNDPVRIDTIHYLLQGNTVECRIENVTVSAGKIKKHSKGLENSIIHTQETLTLNTTWSFKKSPTQTPLRNDLLSGIKVIDFDYTFNKQSGLYIKCFVDKAGQYIIKLSNNNHELIRKIIFDINTTEYFIPLTSFDGINELNGNNKWTLYILQSPEYLSINGEINKLKTIKTSVTIEALGAFQYEKMTTAPVNNGFNHPLDKSDNIYLTINKIDADEASKKTDFFTYTDLEYGLSDEGAYERAGRYYYYQTSLTVSKDILPIIKDADFDATVRIKFKERPAQYKGLSFLIKAEGIKQIRCTFRVKPEDTGKKQPATASYYHDVIIDKAGWIRVIIDFSRIMNVYGKVLPVDKVAALDMSINKSSFYSKTNKKNAVDDIIGTHTLTICLDEIKLFK